MEEAGPLYFSVHSICTPAWSKPDCSISTFSYGTVQTQCGAFQLIIG